MYVDFKTKMKEKLTILSHWTVKEKKKLLMFSLVPLKNDGASVSKVRSEVRLGFKGKYRCDF